MIFDAVLLCKHCGKKHNYRFSVSKKINLQEEPINKLIEITEKDEKGDYNVTLHCDNCMKETISVHNEDILDMFKFYNKEEKSEKEKVITQEDKNITEFITIIITAFCFLMLFTKTWYLGIIIMVRLFFWAKKRLER